MSDETKDPKALFDRLEKAVAALAGGAAPAKSENTVEMTPEQFVEHCAVELEKAAADKPEVRIARLNALVESIKVAKNWEGPTPGPMQIPVFKDPAQLATTTEEKNPPADNGQGGGATNFSQGDPPASSIGVGSQPPGGVNPPQTAAGSGFESNFSKAMAKIAAAVEKMAAAPPDPEKKADDKREPTQKATGVVWPEDINTPFGRGEADEDSLDWGFDKTVAERPFSGDDKTGDA